MSNSNKIILVSRAAHIVTLSSLMMLTGAFVFTIL